MNQINQTKVYNAIPPAAILDNASAVPVVIDTLGYSLLTLFFILGATDIAAVKMCITECATSGGSYTDITTPVTTLAVGTTGDARLPTATDDNGIFMIQVAITPSRLRYMKALFTAGDGSAGTYTAAIAVLSKGEIDPYDATSRGLAGQIIAQL